MLEEIKEELQQLIVMEDDLEKKRILWSIMKKVIKVNTYYNFKILDMESYINIKMCEDLEKIHDTIEKDS